MAAAAACAGVGFARRERRLGWAGAPAVAGAEFRGDSSSVTISILMGLPVGMKIVNEKFTASAGRWDKGVSPSQQDQSRRWGSCLAQGPSRSVGVLGPDAVLDRKRRRFIKHGEAEYSGSTRVRLPAGRSHPRTDPSRRLQNYQSGAQTPHVSVILLACSPEPHTPRSQNKTFRSSRTEPAEGQKGEPHASLLRNVSRREHLLTRLSRSKISRDTHCRPQSSHCTWRAPPPRLRDAQK